MRSTWPGLLRFCGPVVAALGLLHGSIVCLRRPPDADMATLPVLYEAFSRHGFAAFSAWHYTQDNWLLSVILPELPVAAVLGPRPWLPSLLGWLCFVGCCALAGMLARPAIGGARAALLAGVLLCAGPVDLTGIGFLAHPASHDTTCLWSMLAFWAAMSVLRGASVVLLLPCLLALVVAAISDPWARAAFLLPIGLAALAGLLPQAGPMRRRSLLIGLATLPAWAAGGHAFGLLPALTPVHFERGPLGGVPGHLVAGFKGLGLLLSPLPVREPPTASVPAGAGMITIGILVLACLYRRVRRPMLPRSPDDVLSLVCVLSVSGTLLAYGLSAMPPDVAFARLLMNGFFLLPVLFAVELLPHRRRLDALLLGAAAAGFVTAALSSPWMPVREHSVAGPGWQDRLTRFLAANGLRDGYGGYWGTDANASALRSGGQVVIRPVEAPPGGLLPIRPGSSQTFDEWYAPSAGGRTRFFVAVPDPALCPDRLACRRLGERSFGAPDRVLDWEGYDVLVWNHPVLQGPPGDAVLRGLPPLVPDRTLNAEGLVPFLWTGWDLPDGDGSWMRGDRAMLMLPPGHGDACLVLRAASGPDGGPTQLVSAEAAGASLGHWAIPPGVLTTRCVTLSREHATSVILRNLSPRNAAAWILLRSITPRAGAGPAH